MATISTADPRVPDAPPLDRKRAVPRVASVDIVRGAVMVLMALDHVRVYSGLPAGGPTPGIFFTRWITHFCAPAFVFLAGTSAFLAGRRMSGRGELSRFLLVRGVILVVLELTLVRFFWTFNLQFSLLLAGVIWAIGWSMIILALLVRLPVSAVGIIGLAIIGLHNLTDLFAARLGPALAGSGSAWFWQLLYFGGPIGGEGGPVMFVLYSIIPWVGVMAAGYAFGAIMVQEPARRDRLCLQIGLGATAAFLLLRGINQYGNPTPWSGDRMPAWLSFLNPAKYPASLDFLLMTLGPTVALLPLLERTRGAASRVLGVFGRVPLFYYLLHIPLIHLLAIGVSLIREGRVNPWLFGNHPAMNGPPPDGYVWSLGLLYLVWAASVIILYFPSRGYAERKAKGVTGWMRYI
jgi:uncharacterized membrane protein